MSTANDYRNSRYTIQYDISGLDDPTIIATEAATGSTYRMLKIGAPKFFIKLDEGKTTNWRDISSVTGINLGFGAQVLKNVTGNQMQFRTISGSGGVTVSQGVNEVVIGFSGSSKDFILDVNCDPSIAVGDIAVFSSSLLVKPTSNSNSIIPYGVIGMVTAKTMLNKCDILAAGEVTGLFGLTAGSPLFISSTGDLTHTCPTTGNVQQIGFALDSTRMVLDLKQVLRRS